MVPDRDDPMVETPFIISSPRYTARGRATRSMLAFDMESTEIVFLKDYLRADGIEWRSRAMFTAGWKPRAFQISHHLVGEINIFSNADGQVLPLDETVFEPEVVDDRNGPIACF